MFDLGDKDRQFSVVFALVDSVLEQDGSRAQEQLNQSSSKRGHVVSRQVQNVSSVPEILHHEVRLRPELKVDEYRSRHEGVSVGRRQCLVVDVSTEHAEGLDKVGSRREVVHWIIGTEVREVPRGNTEHGMHEGFVLQGPSERCFPYRLKAESVSSGGFKMVEHLHV